MDRKTRTIKRIMIPVSVIAVLAAAFFVYTGIYYHAGPAALSALGSDDAVGVFKTDYGLLFDGPSSENAMIFYPGAKVEETAYAPLLHLLAEKGMDVCLVKMPFRFAFFGVNRAGSVIRQYDYKHYYIGGHSLGGAMAAGYAAAHGDELEGIILLAAYPTKELDKDLLEITVYGSEDEVLNMDKLAEGRKYSALYSEEYEIEGGNHAQFGDYGVQKGDGEASISADEQRKQTVDLIIRAAAER